MKCPGEKKEKFGHRKVIILGSVPERLTENIIWVKIWRRLGRKQCRYLRKEWSRQREQKSRSLPVWLKEDERGDKYDMKTESKQEPDHRGACNLLKGLRFTLSGIKKPIWKVQTGLTWSGFFFTGSLWLQFRDWTEERQEQNKETS